MTNAHSHGTIGAQVITLTAERDRLKEINAEMLKALQMAKRHLHISSDEWDVVDAAITKATGGAA